MTITPATNNEKITVMMTMIVMIKTTITLTMTTTVMINEDKTIDSKLSDSLDNC